MALKRYLKKPSTTTIIFGIICTSLLARIIAVVYFYDASGDGVKHAIYGYTWSLMPYWMAHGGWLPGGHYLAGFANWIIKNPLLAPRFLNMAFGVFTVFSFYKFVRIAFDRDVALYSSGLLAILPLHIAVSGSSLTEASFLFFLINGALLTRAAALNTSRLKWIWLLSASFMVGAATMIRYEAWPVAPLFPLYYLVLSRSLARSILYGLILIIFPLSWILGNFSFFGAALPIVDGAVRGTAAGSMELGFIDAITVLLSKSAQEISWLAIAIGSLGLVISLRKSKRNDLSWDTIFACCFLLCYNLFLIRFVMSRGPSIWPRYLLGPMIMFFPFVSIGIMEITKLVQSHTKSRWSIATSIIGPIVVVTLLLTGFDMVRSHTFKLYKPTLPYLTTQRPENAIAVANWFWSSGLDSPRVLLSKGKQTGYVPLLFPAMATQLLDMDKRFYFVNDFIGSERLKEYINGKSWDYYLSSGVDPSDKIAGDAIGTPWSPQQEVFKSGNLILYRVGKNFKRHLLSDSKLAKK